MEQEHTLALTPTPFLVTVRLLFSKTHKISFLRAFPQAKVLPVIAEGQRIVLLTCIYIIYTNHLKFTSWSFILLNNVIFFLFVIICLKHTAYWSASGSSVQLVILPYMIHVLLRHVSYMVLSDSENWGWKCLPVKSKIIHTSGTFCFKIIFMLQRIREESRQNF